MTLKEFLHTIGMMLKVNPRSDVAVVPFCLMKILHCWTFRFAHTNPLHLDVFQSVVRFEAEVVAMAAALLGSKGKNSGGQICGNMTSGGTESILLAVKSSRDYMKSKKGITRPEMYITCKALSYIWSFSDY